MIHSEEYPTIGFDSIHNGLFLIQLPDVAVDCAERIFAAIHLGLQCTQLRSHVLSMMEQGRHNSHFLRDLLGESAHVDLDIVLTVNHGYGLAPGGNPFDRLC